jgi:hypothetical protein
MVAPVPRADSHDVYTPEATDPGECVHLARPEIDLDTHFTDVISVLAFEDLCDVTLVGNSYFDMINTGVAEQVPEWLAQKDD